MPDSQNLHGDTPWFDATPRNFPGASPSLRQAEVVVVGAGITGLTTAYLLAADGADVLVVDSGPICSGTTGYTTGKVTSQHGLIYASMLQRHGPDRTASYAAAQQAALGRIKRIVDDETISCDLSSLPAYVYAQTESGVEDINKEAEVAQALGLPSATPDGDIGLPYEVMAALRFDDQLIFHPRRYCFGLAAAIVARGGTIVESVPVHDVTEDDDGCEVVTDSGSIRANAVVVATQIPFIARGAFFARTKPTRSYAIADERTELPPGMYISSDEPTRSVRPHRSDDGSYLILGGGGHGTGRDEDTQSYYDDLEAWGRTHFGMEPRWRWSAQDFVPADGVPFIGPVTGGSRRVFVATGYAKWGMTNGTVAAMLISDSIAGRDNEWREAFDSTRIDPVKSAKLVASQGIETASGLIKDRLAAIGAPDLSSLEPGQGDVVRLGGRMVAGYRDPDGTLHAVSARCTHMGCVVRFNDAEKSWDCPCHGSRFDVDGRVVNGPATRELEVIAIEQEPAQGST